MDLRYSEYVPLGINCEAAYQVRRILGRDSASFFSWNVTPWSALESLIRTRFDGILRQENISPHMDGSLMNDTSHDYKFHSPFSRPDFVNDPEFADKLENHRQKVAYLIGKFLRPREPGESAAYFYKADGPEDAAQVRAAANRVRDLLNEIHKDSPFMLVVLQQEERKEPRWGDERIENRYLKRYSPWSDATDGHVQTWDSVFREFPHRDAMQFAGF